ncbi:MAG: flagellin [Acidobacteriota bacterium]
MRSSVIIHNNFTIFKSYHPGQLLAAPSSHQKLETLSNRTTYDTKDVSSIKGRGMAPNATIAMIKGMQGVITLLQTSEAALTSIDPLLLRMRELGEKAADDGYTLSDRAEMQKEIEQINKGINDTTSQSQTQLNRLLNTSDFKLIGSQVIDDAEQNNAFDVDIDKAWPKNLILQVGANEGQEMLVSFKEEHLDLAKLNSRYQLGLVDVTTREKARESIGIVDKAITAVSRQRADILASIKVLEHRINYMTTTSANLQAAEGNIRDVDVAREMMNYSKNMFQQQVGSFFLAHSIKLSYSVLQLFKGI